MKTLITIIALFFSVSACATKPNCRLHIEKFNDLVMNDVLREEINRKLLKKGYELIDEHQQTEGDFVITDLFTPAENGKLIPAGSEDIKRGNAFFGCRVDKTIDLVRASGDTFRPISTWKASFQTGNEFVYRCKYLYGTMAYETLDIIAKKIPKCEKVD